MIKCFIFCALAASLVGCSNDNKITVTNYSQGMIHFSFRAQQYDVQVDSSRQITDIPNGTYVYTATFGVPSRAKSFSVDGTAASGNLLFQKMNTQILVIYGGLISDSVYTVNATMTSSNSSGAATVPTHY
jgi:hypothetical protein